MIIIAEHPERGRKEFAPNIWDAIRQWPDQGGWRQVNEKPVEAAPEAAEPVAKKKSK